VPPTPEWIVQAENLVRELVPAFGLAS